MCCQQFWWLVKTVRLVVPSVLVAGLDCKTLNVIMVSLVLLASQGYKTLHVVVVSLVLVASED